MLKKIFSIFSLVMLLVMSCTAVALADAPNPFANRYRRHPSRPQPVAVVYNIVNETIDTESKEDKIIIELEYKAPEEAQIDYYVQDSMENRLQEGTARSDTAEGTILLTLDKPIAGEKYEVTFKSFCFTAWVKTEFGKKYTEMTVPAGSWSCTYTLSCDEDGQEYNIQQSNISRSN